jgi:class 3 adenylate cyclase/TolB-like protein/tetratricopeptide (TPR) repeat protein
MSETRKLAAILVSDVVGYSRLAGADEDRILARLRTLRSDLIDPIIAVHHGRIVKRTGDGSIIEFRSVVDAVRCAIEVQSGLIERNAGVPDDKRIQFRIGIHLGDVVEESDGDLMGDGVNVAARLQGIAKPGAICLSEQAYWQVKGRLDLAVTDLGKKPLKNIAEPVHAYSVEVGKRGAPRKAMPALSKLFPALAVLAAILAIAGGWRFIASKPSATAPPAVSATSSSFGPAVAVFPLANATGDVKNDALALRLGQKAADYLGKYGWLRTIGRSGGAAKIVADPIAAARELNADYVVTGEVDSGADSPRATFHVDGAHSGERVWSQTLAPLLEDPKSGAAEEELAGRAASLMQSAIFNAELTRAKAKKEGERTTYDCVVVGFSAAPDTTTARLRDCLEAATQKEPLNAMVWAALAVVVDNQRVFGWGLPPDEASIEKRSHLADRGLQAAVRAVDLAPQDAGVQSQLAHGFHAKCELDRFKIEAEKAVALNPYDADNLGWLGIGLAFSGFWDEGTAFAEKAIKLTGPAASPQWWLAPAKRHWFRGEYQEAYDAFQHSYQEWFWLSHLDLAYTLPFLGRIDEAKAHVATLLKMDPTMTIAEADAFYRLFCFEPAFREKMARALRQAGLPEGDGSSN